MTPTLARNALSDLVLSQRPSEESIQERVNQIQRDVVAHSRYIREANFTSIHSNDLEFLFAAYVKRFFASLCRPALEGRRLRFRLSPRMTMAGGKTTRFTARNGEVSYEIAIASSLLFDGFGEMDRAISACGLECKNRLAALQRIFEHEMVHLTELLCWENSECRGARFQDIARRLFLHEAHTHNLITRRERAAVSGIRIGSRVTFGFEGQRMTGRVNRVTKRATVLVEDSGGRKYSDGSRYKSYYVPIAHLELVAAHSAGA